MDRRAAGFGGPADVARMLANAWRDLQEDWRDAIACAVLAQEQDHRAEH